MNDQDAACLRREAKLCRSLAALADELSIAEQLIVMAEEYETRASELEGEA